VRKLVVLLLMVLTSVIGIAGTALAEHGSILPFNVTIGK